MSTNFQILQVWVYFELYRSGETSSLLFTNADGEEYSIIAEFSEVSLPMTLTVPVMYFVAFFPVPFCWYRRRSIMRELEKKKERISEVKRADHKKFVMVGKMNRDRKGKEPSGTSVPSHDTYSSTSTFISCLLSVHFEP